MAKILFRPINLSDCKSVQEHVYNTNCRNCDLNFMNLMSWRFLYETELAFHCGWLLFRFKATGHLAYLPPIGRGDWKDVLKDMAEDARSYGENFRLMGVCEQALNELNKSMPGYFQADFDRSYSDYIYKRERLVSLSGKKLQPKRNFINRFMKSYPNYEYLPLTEDLFDECRALVNKWHDHKPSEVPVSTVLSPDQELDALDFTFNHWLELGGKGGALLVGGKLIAFSYGAAINYDTFDICAEKADIAYEGAFAMINREFARSLPEQYVYINREEDLGIEGLRKAKLSYQPDCLLNKYIVIPKLCNR